MLDYQLETKLPEPQSLDKIIEHKAELIWTKPINIKQVKTEPKLLLLGV